MSAAPVFPMELPDRAIGRGHQLFDLRVQGELISQSMELVYWDITSDISILRLTDERRERVQGLLGGESFGFYISDRHGLDSCTGGECSAAMV